MKEAQHTSPGDQGILRPALREDLTFVLNNGETGDGGMHIVDPVSGQSFACDPVERALCQAADGATDLDGLFDRIQGQAGGRTHDDVAAFFNRLGMMGLLAAETAPEEAPVDAADAPPPGAKPFARARRPGRNLAGAAERAESQGASEARRDLLAKRRRELRERTQSGSEAPPPLPTDAAKAPEDQDPADEAAAQAEGPAPADPVGETTDKDFKQPKKRRTGAVVKKAAALRDLGRPAPEARGSARDLLKRRRQELAEQKLKKEPEPVKPGTGSVSDETPSWPKGSAGPEEGGRQEKPATPAPQATPEDTGEAIPHPQVIYVKKDAALAGAAEDAMIRRLRDRTSKGFTPQTGVLSEDIDTKPRPRRAAASKSAAQAGQTAGGWPQQEDDASGAAGMGRGMGRGMRFGMMSGGAGMPGGGAGMQGGGQFAARRLAGMGPGIGQGMGPGLGQGMMGAGARTGGANRGDARADGVPLKRAAQLHLIDPQKLLRLLYVVGYPLKFVLWLVVPLTILAVFTIFNNMAALRADIARAASDFSSVASLAISLLTVNLGARLAQGVAIVACKGRVKSLGFGLVFGVLPRFVIDRSGIADLDRSGQLWGYGSVLLARLFIFALATLTWAIMREQGSELSILALIVSQTALMIFLVTAFPLVPADGQRWIGVMLNEPKLMAKMVASTRYLIKGGRLPPMISREDVTPLALFAIATVLCTLALFGTIMVSALIWLEAELDGTGVLLFLVGLASFLLWFRAMLRNKRRGKGTSFDRVAFRDLALEDAGQPRPAREAQIEVQDDGEAALSGSAKVVWALILAGFVAVAFLPYDYYAGGQVDILPASRGEAVARSDGELVEILVTEGAIVAQGDVLARLSSWDQQAAVAVAQARLEGARATLARLNAGAKAEEVELARREVEAAAKEVTFYEAEAERARELLKTGTVAAAALERAESNLANRLADLEVARAQLELVESPPTAEELAIAESDVARLERELAFAEGELERTVIAAPIDGRVISPNLDLRRGSFMRSGEALLEVEESDVVRAEIRVPESDISLISVGDTVRLRTWGNSAEEAVGTVETIAPAVDKESYGSVVRVGARFPNPDDALRTGMTGFAKIYGGEMRVWEAYLRSIRRFFQVEVWSWVP